MNTSRVKTLSQHWHPFGTLAWDSKCARLKIIAINTAVSACLQGHYTNVSSIHTFDHRVSDVWYITATELSSLPVTPVCWDSNRRYLPGNS